MSRKDRRKKKRKAAYNTSVPGATIIRFIDVLTLLECENEALTQDEVRGRVNLEIATEKYHHTRAVAGRSTMSNVVERLRVAGLITQSGTIVVTTKGKNLLAQLPDDRHEINAVIEIRDKSDARH